MFGTFVNRISSLLDRRFLVGSWFPVLCGSLLLGAAYVVTQGWRRTVDHWTGLTGAAQVWLAVAALAGVTLCAFLVHVAPVVRLFEGYPFPSWVKAWGGARQIVRRDRSTEIVSLRDFPRAAGLVKPTRLGNVLTAAEEYPYLRYRIDAVVWWPRLAPVTPQVFRDQLDEALLPMVALVNAALVLPLAGTAGAAIIAAGGRWAIAAGFGIGGAALATLAYKAALPPARAYAGGVRAAFDLYRHDLLTVLRLAPPENLVAERLLWDSLTQWVYRGEPPTPPLSYRPTEGPAPLTAKPPDEPEK